MLLLCLERRTNSIYSLAPSFYASSLVLQARILSSRDPLKLPTNGRALPSTPFDTIDAVINFPGLSSEKYLFSGAHSVRINLGKGKIIYGPCTIIDQWPGLVSARFTTIDAAIPVPDANVEGEHFVFKGSQYVRTQVIPGAADKLTWGIKPIADYWKVLGWS